MRRTTIVLPENLRHRLRRVAADRGVSMSEMIRQAIEDLLAEDHPVPKSIGIGASGRSDIARRAGDFEYEPPSWR